MSIRALHIALAVMMVCVMAVPATAAIDDQDQPLISLTPYLGGAFWAKDLGLNNSFHYGGRAALHFTQWLYLEGSYGLSKAKFSDAEVNVDMTHNGVDLVFDLMPRSKYTPYLTGGWGQLIYEEEHVSRDVVLNGWEAGVGLKIRLGGNNANYRALRIDVRDVVAKLTHTFPNEGKTSHNILATAGVQFSFGFSSKDSDGDGIRDKDDHCPDTPAGAVVNVAGCPEDSDNDGVFDGIDQCPDTPAGATVDAYGCPTDSDGDGVLDGLDKCPNTPIGAKVDVDGCPTDSDGDGVYDGIDQCPDTPAHLEVDEFGCPIITSATEMELLDTGRISTSQIVFTLGSAELASTDNEVLDEIGETLSNWPELMIEIGGYTDSSGSEELNQKLSEQRAQGALDYLVAKYPDIDPNQFTVVGYGESNPIADNSTREGRALNRRVEFKVLNPEELHKVMPSSQIQD